MDYLRHALRVRIETAEAVITARALAKAAVSKDGRGIDGVQAGRVKRNGVKRGEHTHVRNDRRVIAAPAVTVGRDVNDHIDIEVRLILHNGEGILRDLAVEDLGRRVHLGGNGVLIACAHAMPTAEALIMVNMRFAVNYAYGVLRTLTHTAPAADAQRLIDDRLIR